MDTTFEEMRQQMAILKEKLEKQEIVNDSIIRQSMKKNASSILNRYYIIAVLCLFLIPYGYWVFVKLQHFSLAFWIGTCVFMLICFCATIYNGRFLHTTRRFDKDLVETRQAVARAKKLDRDWLFIGFPMLFVWLGWYFYEIHQQIDKDTTAFFIGAAVGTVIGAAIGLSLHIKTQRQYQEIIEQIEDLKKIED